MKSIRIRGKLRTIDWLVNIVYHQVVHGLHKVAVPFLCQ